MSSLVHKNSRVAQNPTGEALILCVGNGGFCRKGNGLYEVSQTTRFLRELAQSLGAVTYCQPLVEFRDGETLAEDNLSLEPNLRLIGIPLGNSSKFWKALCYLAAIPRLFFEIKKVRFLYIFFPGNLSLVCGLMARALRKPYGIYLRGEVIIAPSITRLVMERVKFVLTISPPLYERVRRSCRDVEMVAPMVDLIAEDITAERVHRAHGPWLILFVGRVEKRKGLPELIAAASILHAKGIDFRLILAGGGPELNKHKDGLPPSLVEHIHFLGPVRDRCQLKELYRSADLFVFPSHDEGFPRVLYEAMAFGTPIVTTFVGGIPYILEDGVDCLRVEVNDAKAMAECMCGLLQNVALRKSLSIQARLTLQELMSTWKQSHASQLVERLEKYGLAKARGTLVGKSAALENLVLLK